MFFRARFIFSALSLLLLLGGCAGTRDFDEAQAEAERSGELYRQGLNEFKQGEYARSEQTMTRALESRIRANELCMQTDDCRFNDRSAVDAVISGMYHMRGRARVVLQDFDGGLADSRQAVEYGKSSGANRDAVLADAYEILVLAHLGRGEKEPAVKAFEALAEIDMSRAKALLDALQ